MSLPALFGSDFQPANMSNLELPPIPRKRCKSHLPDAQRKRNEKKKARRDKGEGPIEKKIKYYVENSEDHESLLLTVEQAKKCITEGTTSTVSNYKILVTALDFFLSHHKQERKLPVDNGDGQVDENNSQPAKTSYQYCEKTQCTEDIYLTTPNSIQHLIALCDNHRKCESSL